ncbi:MAG TPA: hypothetical protein VIL99_06240 [Ignavibacteria bacterium]
MYIEKEIPMLEKLLDFYRKSDGATKKKIPGCIIAEKLDEWHRAQSAGLRAQWKLESTL